MQENSGLTIYLYVYLMLSVNKVLVWVFAKCVDPENIISTPREVIRNSKGDGEGGSKSNVFKAK